ncbi:hypothetical protein [Paucidesulfovibrio longus]|uniref:hypothetical protein n=1 Tax=Paucidesulfovibrio longus TaxID=889 RepID=UPI0003B6D6A2|nr:hypothetical protein [Paucidesulfovibrio longus]
MILDDNTETMPPIVEPPAQTGPQSRWNRAMAVVTALLSAVAVKLTCPACWSAYAALLGSTGVAGFASIPYLFPLTLLSLLLVTASLAYGAKKRQGYGPLLLGLVGSGTILLGNFTVASIAMQNAGVAALVGASIWNSWPRSKSNCPACVQVEMEE